MMLKMPIDMNDEVLATQHPEASGEAMKTDAGITLPQFLKSLFTIKYFFHFGI